MKFIQTEKAYKIVETIHEKGHEVYFVGGGVRDLICNQRLGSKDQISTRDLDIATSLIPRKIQDLVKRFVEEESFTSKNLLLVNVDGIDISQFKKENSDYFEGKSDKKYFGSNSIIEDAKVRDFTINSIYLTHDGKFLDFFGGQRDIQQKLIKSVIEADECFKRDPFRILRMYYLKLKLNFDIENKTYQASVKNRHLLHNYNKYQLRILVSKLIESKLLDAFIEELRKEGVLEIVFPEIQATFDKSPTTYNRTLKTISKMQKKKVEELHIFALFFSLFGLEGVALDELVHEFGHKREERSIICFLLEMLTKRNPFESVKLVEDLIINSADKETFLLRVQSLEKSALLIQENIWKDKTCPFKEFSADFEVNYLANYSDDLFGLFHNFVLRLPQKTLQDEGVKDTKEIVKFYLKCESMNLTSLIKTERTFYKHFNITTNPLKVTEESAIQLGVPKDKARSFLIELKIRNISKNKDLRELAKKWSQY